MTKNNNLEKKPDGTVNFRLSIPSKKVKTAYNKALSIATLKAEIKGFRKGKAPASLVEKEIGKQKLYTQTLQLVLPDIYAESVKKHNLKPIISPKIEPEQLEEGKDWKLKVTTAEKPKIILGNYKKIASDALASSKIWVPGKDPAKPETQQKEFNEEKPKTSTDEKISKVFDALLKSIKFPIPEFLLQDDISRQLSQLVQQLERLNLTVEQYLSSLGKTTQQLREEYKAQSERNLRLEFILNEIALDLKIKVEDKEIDQLINSVGDAKLKENLKKPSERSVIINSLRKRKVIDFLLKS